MLETFDPHSLVFALAGLAALGGALLPRLIGHLPASPPMIFLALGFVVFSLPLGLMEVDPIERGEVTEYLTEVGVIVALMGAGLKLDRPLGWCTWQPTIRLLAITMPLTSRWRRWPAGGRWGWRRRPRCCSGRCWRRPTRCWPRTCRSGRPVAVPTRRTTCASR